MAEAEGISTEVTPPDDYEVPSTDFVTKVSKPGTLCRQCIEMLKKESAKWHCKICNDYFCDLCKERHSIAKLTKDHHLTYIFEGAESISQIPQDDVRKDVAESISKIPQNDVRKDVAESISKIPQDDVRKDVAESISKIKQDDVRKYVAESISKIPEDDVRCCQVCSELGAKEKATSFCIDCDEILCSACMKRHSFSKISRNHKIATIEEYDVMKKEAKANCDPCRNMGNEETATSFCNECEEYLCNTCTRQHNVSKLTKNHILSSAREQLQRLLEEKKIDCEPCNHLGENALATVYCKDCTEHLCVGCQKRHEVSKLTKSHLILTIEEYLEMEKNENITLCDPCQHSHRKEKAVSFCIDCKEPEPLCEECSKYHTAQKNNRNHRLSKDLKELQEFGNLNTKEVRKTEKSAKGAIESNPDIIYSRKDVRAETAYLETGNKKELSNQKPGKPMGTKIKSDSITLSWTTPKSFQKDDYYQIRYKNLGEGKWRFYDEQPSEGTIIITKLRANTSFVFQVRVIHDDMEGPYSETSDEIQTKESPANRLFAYSTLVRKGPPDLYHLPLTENERARKTNAKTRKFDLGAPPTRGEEKTIMLVGATGTGKSTLVDGIVNYVLGVNWDDSFRYTLVDLEEEEERKKHNQAFSQTEWITCYSINMEEGSRLNYRLNIIDTPGFGDTRGLERDQQVVDQIHNLFSARGEQGVVFIDAVCFLIKAPDARLTAVQKYIFHAIMSLFGNDIEQNICTMITFADGDDPPVLHALKEAKLSFGNWFPFNNSGLFANNKDTGNVRTSLTPMFWEMGLKSFYGFFKQLEKMETKSLQLTQRVLTQRQRLELTIQNLQPQVDAGLSKLNELSAELQIIEQHKTDIEANRNFIYKVTETKQVKHDLPKGQHVTNCLNCHVTCHRNCMIPRDEDKARCCAMGPDGNCTQCSENCHWQQHANTPYIFEYIQEECTKTYEEKQEKYRRAEGEKMTHEKVVQRMEDELHELEEDIHQMMEIVKECNEILKEIALRPNPLSMVEHIDMLIESEKLEKRTGFKERISILKKFRKRAEIGKDVDRFRQGVHSARRARHGGSLVTAEVVPDTGGLKRAFKAFRNIFK